MQNEVKHYKDAAPQETVSRIRTILGSYGIDLVESWNESGIGNCCSLKLTIAGTTRGTNGKGITEDFARASAHAELMERLQTGKIISRNFETKDEFRMSKDELLLHSLPVLEEISSEIQLHHDAAVSPMQLAQLAVDLDDGQTARCQLYKNICNQETMYLPVSLISDLSGSNGLAAGNTPEEALVQGFSEIIERACQIKILKEKQTPPTIPMKFIQQFERSWASIQDIKSHGFDVIVKDCSCAMGYPVVATVIINRETHDYHVHLGASPIFEIALERALTESFQGRSIERFAGENQLLIDSKITNHELLRSFVYGHGQFPVEFFGQEASYPFVPPVQLERTQSRDLLDFCIHFAQKNNLNVFVKDFSVLGFPTVKIVVPNYSTIVSFRAIEDTQHLCLSILLKRVPDIVKNVAGKSNEDYKTLVDYYNKTCYGRNPTLFTKAAKVYLDISVQEDISLFKASVAYAAWELKDYTKVQELLGGLISYSKNTNKEVFFSFLHEVLTLMQSGVSYLDSIGIVSNFYPESVCGEVLYYFVNNINPLSRFVFLCDDRCENCRYADRCTNKRVQELSDIICNATQHYQDS